MVRYAGYCAAGAVLIAVALFVRDRYGPGNEIRREGRALESRRDAAKTLGLPLAVADFDGGERAKGISNLSAFSEFDSMIAQDTVLRHALEVSTEEADAGEMLLAKPEMTRALVAASKIERVDMPVRWDEGMIGRETDYGIFSRYVAACCYLAMKRIEANDPAGALSWLEAGARIGSQLIDEPSTRAALSWTSCTNRVLRTLYGFLRERQSSTLLAGAPHVLAELKVPSEMTLYLKADCLRSVLTARMYDRMIPSERLDLQLQPPNDRIEPPSDPGAGAALESNALHHWGQMLPLSRPNDGDLMRAGTAMDDAAALWFREEDPASYLSRSLGRIYQSVAISIQRAEQMKRLVATALEVIVYRGAHGQFPDSLSPDVSHSDPIGQRPFVYEPTKRGFSLLATGQRTDGQMDPPRGDLRLVPLQGYALSYGD